MVRIMVNGTTVRIKGYETMSKFVKVMPRILYIIFWTFMVFRLHIFLNRCHQQMESNAHDYQLMVAATESVLQLKIYQN